MSLHRSIVEEVPQLKRGQVWCVKCGATFKVDSARSLRHGWPLCCGQTMTIDSPAERATYASDTAVEHDAKQAATLTEQRAELYRANEYALRLVLSLAARFPAVEGFQAFPDLYGRLSQIDNMTCKLPLGFGNDTAAEPKR